MGLVQVTTIIRQRVLDLLELEPAVGVAQYKHQQTEGQDQVVIIQRLTVQGHDIQYRPKAVFHSREGDFFPLQIEFLDGHCPVFERLPLLQDEVDALFAAKELGPKLKCRLDLSLHLPDLVHVVETSSGVGHVH